MDIVCSYVNFLPENRVKCNVLSNCKHALFTFLGQFDRQSVMNLWQVVLGSTMIMRQKVFCPKNPLEDLARFRVGGAAEIWPSSSLLLSDKTIGFVVDDPLDILLVGVALLVDNGRVSMYRVQRDLLFESVANLKVAAACDCRLQSGWGAGQGVEASRAHPSRGEEKGKNHVFFRIEKNENRIVLRVGV